MYLLSLLLGIFTFVEFNTENLFDTQHDSLKQDYEFLPSGDYHWTPTRYWRKLNNIGQEIISCGEYPDSNEWTLPDMVALCEVENDSVMRDLTRRSLLRGALYKYIITNSPDARGIDVALMYNPSAFRLVSNRSIRIDTIPGLHPTRDILYAYGKIKGGKMLHVFVVHAPSRRGGEQASRPNRLHVATILSNAVDSVYRTDKNANIIVAGDFNDYTDNASLELLYTHGLRDVSAKAKGSNGAKGTYKYRGEWGSLDHILCSISVDRYLQSCCIADRIFALTEDSRYGGVQPFRNYNGPKYNNGFSDHLPLVARFKF